MPKTSSAAVINRRTFLKTTAAAASVAAAGGALAAVPVAPVQHRWGFLIDLRKCVGCKACAVACKTEFDVRLGVFRSNVKEYEEGAYPDAKRSFVPWLCNQIGRAHV